MELVFVCSLRNQVFKSSNFHLIKNKGVITDEHGNKTLDAKIILNEPCPLCGEIHTYHVSELTCPFNV